MTESKFNMDALFSKSHKEDYKEKDIFKKAALLYEFDIEKDFAEFSPADISLLKENSFLKPDQKRRLKKEDRVDILSEKIGKQNLSSTIQQYNIENDFIDLVKKVEGKETVNLNQLPDNQLYYATVLSEVYKDEVDGNEAQRIYQRRQFFNQFERITKNFVGREEEIKRINNYIDWLPKQGIFESISSSFKNIIGWHDKPPLLIKGVGGVGKSALIAKVIAEQNTQMKGKSLPFIYIDFDLPGFSIAEPMTLLLESLRQIEIQNPAYAEIIDAIKRQISEMILDKDGNKTIEKTNASQRGLVFESIGDIIKRYNVEISKIRDTPILIVFDSFEEMQYRATSAQLFSFFTFIQEVSELIPRIRPIFVGRAEIDESFLDFNFDALTITDFDERSAMALLERLDVKESSTREFIYKNFGGIPLMLLLAANVYNKEDVDKTDKKKVIDKKWEYLVTRILGHIHNKKVRNIAIPGMLVRHISPEVIMHILAKPTKIYPIELEEAKQIYEELKKETALITRSEDSDSFSFRQDLRMTCEKMILEKFSDAAAQIRENAIEYYSKYEEENDPVRQKKYQAEYYYHLLKNQAIPVGLTIEVYDELRPYLEQSIIELPESSRIFVQTLNRSAISLETISSTRDLEWENYYTGLIKDSLRGELGFMEKVNKELRERNRRTKDGFTEFGYFEALLLQRLDKIRESNRRIDRACSYYRKNEEDQALFVSFSLLKVQNLEYEEKYRLAIAELNNLKDFGIDFKDKERMKMAFLEVRLQSRLNEFFNSDYIQNQPRASYPFSEGDFDIKWNSIFNSLEWQSNRFLTKGEYRNALKRIQRAVGSESSFQRHALNILGTYVDNLTLVGKERILMHDITCFMEVMGRGNEQVVV